MKAADALSVTPPAVSQQLRQLEEACGSQLFERVGRRLRLTSAGETLRTYANRIFAILHDAEVAVEKTRNLATGRLQFIVSETAAAYYLPPLWTQLRREYPGIYIQIALDNSRRVRERLLAFEYDVGVVGDSGHPDLVLVPFVEDPLVVIVAPKHEWARRRDVTLEELAQEHLVLRETGSASRELLERQMAAHGLDCQASMEIASNEIIKRAVELNNGVSVISESVVRREVAGDHLRAIRVRGGVLSRTISLAYHRERADSPLIQAVLKVARGVKASKQPARRSRKRRH